MLDRPSWTNTVLKPYGRPVASACIELIHRVGAENQKHTNQTAGATCRHAPPRAGATVHRPFFSYRREGRTAKNARAKLARAEALHLHLCLFCPVTESLFPSKIPHLFPPHSLRSARCDVRPAGAPPAALVGAILGARSSGGSVAAGRSDGGDGRV